MLKLPIILGALFVILLVSLSGALFVPLETYTPGDSCPSRAIGLSVIHGGREALDRAKKDYTRREERWQQQVKEWEAKGQPIMQRGCSLYPTYELYLL